jgi:predicted DNA-binding transcriptional regulator AlpA
MKTISLPSPAPEALWDIRGVAAYLHVSATTVERFRRHGELPSAIILGRIVRWEPSDIRAWALTRKETVTSTNRVAA